MNNKHQKVAVAGFLAHRGTVLVIRRSNQEQFLPGYYELPGGKVDFGEHPVEALKREFKEEVGLSIDPIKPYRVFDYVSGEIGRHTVELVYHVRFSAAMSDVVLSDAHDDYKWIDESMLDSLAITDEIRQNILEGFKQLS